MPVPVTRRKCRECGKESLLAFDPTLCPKCGAAYGPLELGSDTVPGAAAGAPAWQDKRVCSICGSTSCDHLKAV